MTTRIPLMDFIERFIPKYTLIRLYLKEGNSTSFLWQGMEWHLTSEGDELESCRNYKYLNVVEIKADSRVAGVSLVVEK